MSVLARIAILAPWCANFFAIESPIPLLAPEITTFLFLNNDSKLKLH